MEWRHNLEHGARAEWLANDDPLRERLERLARDAAAAIGLRFCSVDIAGTWVGLKMVELNSTVLFEKAVALLPSGDDAAVRLYTKALRALFA